MNSWFCIKTVRVSVTLDLNTVSVNIEAKLAYILTDTKHRAASLRQQSYLYYEHMHDRTTSDHALNFVIYSNFFLHLRISDFAPLHAAFIAGCCVSLYLLYVFYVSSVGCWNGSLVRLSQLASVWTEMQPPGSEAEPWLPQAFFAFCEICTRANSDLNTKNDLNNKN